MGTLLPGYPQCNMLLKNIDDVPKATDDSEEAHATYVKQYKAEAHFLRAYFYWEMFLRYGPVPWLPDGTRSGRRLAQQLYHPPFH